MFSVFRVLPQLSDLRVHIIIIFTHMPLRGVWSRSNNNYIPNNRIASRLPRYDQRMGGSDFGRRGRRDSCFLWLVQVRFIHHVKVCSVG